MTLFASSALAAKTHPYTGTSFGPDGTTATSFSNLQSIAVDQASGDVFAYDAGAGGKVYKFNAAGNPVNFSGLSGNAIEGVGGANNGENEIAVAPAGSPGGTAGDIYVANNSVVKIYSPAGAPLGELTGGETCGIAVAPNGHVFVGVYGNEIREYVPSANPATNADEAPVKSSGVVSGICNVAADGLGNVYAAGYSGGPVSKLEGLADSSATPLDPSANTLAVDPTTNDLYTDRRSEFSQYSSTGKLIGTSGAGQLSESQGIAVNAAAEKIYAATKASGKVDVFGAAIVIPGVTVEAPTEVTGKKATLHAKVNPAGLAVSSCVFEYGTTSAYGSSKPCEGTLPSDEADHPVTAALTGLTPNTEYHVRIVAKNTNGANQSSDQTFTTNQPAVTREATGVTGSKATLHGAVLPEGEAISECVFEYGTSESYGRSISCEGGVPSDEAEHEVSAQLAHLAPNGTTYYFRLSITRASGTSHGGDRSFLTEATVITTGSSAVTDTGATVEGTLNPEGTPYTECAFEYGTSESYGQSIPCAESPGEIGTGNAPVAVHADLSGLNRGTVYHFRLAGTNADGTATGGDEAFTTLGARIEAEWAASVGQTEATLKAKINPEGSPTTYRFEYGIDTSYGTGRTEESEVGADESEHTVATFLTGLTPGTIYHYRYVATNSIGVTAGPDRTFTTPSPPTSETSCPNSAFRTGPATRMADCRAYEMVSPIEKNNVDISTLLGLPNYRIELNQTATSGERLTYTSYQGFADPEGVPYVSQYLATRTASGWSNQSLNPSGGENLNSVGNRLESEFGAFSPDLCVALLDHYADPPIAPGATEGILNTYKRSNCGTPQYETVSTVPFGSEVAPPPIQGLSADGRCALFVPSQYESNALYETCGSQTQIVSVLPNGNTKFRATAGTVFDSSLYEESSLREGNYQGSISADGSRIYWTSTTGVGPLYVRVNAQAPQSLLGPSNECLEPDKACTVPVSAESANAEFWAASTDGERAIYAVRANSSPTNLYEFNLATGQSTLLASGLKGFMGANSEATRIYFVSQESLSGFGTSGKPNLYLYDSTKAGAARFAFIATISEADLPGGGLGLATTTPSHRLARVSPDGLHAVFSAYAPLTGYDNVDAATGRRDLEVFAYDALSNGGAGSLSCVSCNPSGQRPRGVNVEVQINTEKGLNPAAALVPPPTTAFYASRAMSDDGDRVFFDSYDALLPKDGNGQEDVYEWEAPGSGPSGAQCTDESSSFSPANGGCLNLVSSAESPSKSEFVDASPDGRDVFFKTASSLVQQDPGLIDIYDARQEGGFAPPPSPPSACEGEACQGPASPPQDATPSSASFSGPGNVKTQKAKKHKAKHYRAKHHKAKDHTGRANKNREAGR